MACSTYTPQPANRNLNVSYLYNPSISGFNVSVVGWHNSDKTTRIFCLLKKSELTFYQDENVRKTGIRIKYNLYNNKSLKITDSANVVLFLNDHSHDTLVASFLVNTPDTVTYLLDITISDVNRPSGRRVFFDIDRTHIVNTQDYLMVNPYGALYFSNIVQPEDTFIFKTRFEKKQWVWRKSYASHNFQLPYPPHTLTIVKPFVFQPDSSFRFLCTDTTRLTLEKECILHFHNDTTPYGGYTVCRYHNHFPETKNPYRMLQPLHYLTSNREYAELNLYAEKKNGVDKFWLEAASGPDRARELIKVFYTRVAFANRYFTSYTEGWKTDRGMLYVVLGLPNTIYKTHHVERWIYGNSQSNATLTFNFEKRNNPLCSNDFILNRNESFKITWIQAVDAWRNGRIFSVGN
jgi:GWxTD domain-containing protein